ncbi:MAG: flavodoxin family protein [Clostridia bacterium]|nr:flavodoxin family protein [Clostridia bacterium]
MKVLLINGSPKESGCTYTALMEVSKALTESGIETELISVGKNPIQGCIGCGGCAKAGNSRCIFQDDIVNTVIEKAEQADGFILGTPVHYAAASGAITSLMDRVCYAGGKHLAFKPGAAIASCRRGGASAAFDQLNKYFTILNMPVVSSNYWNQVHGNTPEEVLEDLEGLQTMRQLGRNMAWLLKSIEAGKQAGVSMPEVEPKIKTNYIR